MDGRLAGSLAAVLAGVQRGAAILRVHDVAETVQALKLGKGHLYVTLDWIYLRDLGVNETARRMRKAVSTVHAHLEQADHWIAAWLDMEREAKERARAQALAVQQHVRAGLGSFTP